MVNNITLSCYNGVDSFSEATSKVSERLHHYDNVGAILKVHTDFKNGLISLTSDNSPYLKMSMSDELKDKNGNSFYRFSFADADDVNDNEIYYRFDINAQQYDMVKDIVHNYIYKQLAA